jgi:hypothetical protein
VHGNRREIWTNMVAVLAGVALEARWRPDRDRRDRRGHDEDANAFGVVLIQPMENASPLADHAISTLAPLHRRRSAT